MREFYDRCPEENRPKIFGMTASPVNTRSAIHSARYHSFLSNRYISFIAILINFIYYYYK